MSDKAAQSMAGQAFMTDDCGIEFHEEPKGRRPIEAIETQLSRSAQARQDVEKALARLIKAGAPFTVADVMRLSGRGRTMIYEQEDLKEKVLKARDASKAARAETNLADHDKRESSWKERAQQAECLAKSLHETIKQRDQRIAELQALLRDTDGVLLAVRLEEKDDLIVRLQKKITQLEGEKRSLSTGLSGSRANLIRERERNMEAHEQAETVTPIRKP